MKLPLLPPAVAGLLVSSLAHAQTWVPLTPGVPPGTPAELTVDPTASGDQATVLDLRVHGFWRTDVVGDDGQAYTRLDFPGLGEVGQVGAPELPALRPSLAVPTDAAEVRLLTEVAYPAGLSTFPMTVYPTPVPGLDGDEHSHPEQFVKDEALYASSGAWPALAATDVAPIGLRFGSVPYGALELFPARFDPATAELVVAPHLRVAYEHAGAVQAFAPITKDRELQCKAAFPNWPFTGPWFAANEQTYEGRYLIVTPEEYLDELAPFVAYRKATGFQVTVKTLEDLGYVACWSLRSMIDAWYAAGLPQYDHYALLVGDADVIPMCTSPNAALIPGDDAYGSPSGLGDLDEEIYVGRLSVNDGADLALQLDKIIAYETDQTPAHDYGRTLLVAHEEEDPKWYALAHEAVANALYAVSPTFAKVYGTVLGDENFDVKEEIEDGVGLVAYRGHGGRYEWSAWSWLKENWGRDEVEALTNTMLPVVWSFSCLNQSIDSLDDCIGEHWLEVEHGAVAHYGSSIASGTKKNHVLDAAMFEAVFGLGLTTHAQAIEYAENAMKAALPDDSYQNEWMYFLLGDPAMKIRRGAPWKIQILAPESVPAVPGSGPSTFTAQVLDPSTGGPVAGVLVSAYKAGFSGGDEVFANAYTDANGLVLLPSPQSLGDLVLSVRDLDGNVTLQSLPAQVGAFTDLGDALAGTHGAPLLSSGATLLPGSTCEIEVENGLPFGIGALAVGGNDNPVSLLGGIVHPFPSAALVPVVLDDQGAWSLKVDPWPAQAPGTQLVMQAAILDAGAPQGVALTNALRAVTP